jgi:putative sugar O-methyltransferase
MIGNQPSRFWERLGADHTRDLETYGLEQFKRRQALRYFTWRWSWNSLRRSEQMRYLLAHTSPLTWYRCATARSDLSDRAWRGVAWGRHDRWLYSFAVRLLWEYARSRDQASVLRLPEPTLGDPLPVYWRGRLISQDLANSALEASAIARALQGRVPSSILEIGAGYGRSAYVLLNLYPTATYTIVDIEPAIRISRSYLSQLFPDRQISFLSPAQAMELPVRSVALALSISSLQEMTAAQVQGYLSLLDRVAAGGSVYLKQWARWWNPEDRVSQRFDDYPVPPHWRALFKEQSPVQTAFRQAAWALP